MADLQSSASHSVAIVCAVGDISDGVVVLLSKIIYFIYFGFLASATFIINYYSKERKYKRVWQNALLSMLQLID